MESPRLNTIYSSDGNPPKLELQTHHNLYQNSSCIPSCFVLFFFFLVEIHKQILKFIWKCKGPRIAKIILKRKKKLKDLHFVHSKHTAIIRRMWYWHKDRSMEWNKMKEFPLWLSSNEPHQYPWGCGFDPWPRSVGWGSSIAVSCGVSCRHSLDLPCCGCGVGQQLQLWFDP